MTRSNFAKVLDEMELAFEELYLNATCDPEEVEDGENEELREVLLDGMEKLRRRIG